MTMLCAGAPAWFEQTRHGAKVAGPVGLAHGLDHLNGADGVERRVLNVAVVLQAQIRPGPPARPLNAAGPNASCSVESVTPVTWA